jgi:hypothetical protein
MPADVHAVAHLVKAGVTRRVIAEQDVVGAVAGEIADSHDTVGGRGTAMRGFYFAPAGAGGLGLR